MIFPAGNNDDAFLSTRASACHRDILAFFSRALFFISRVVLACLVILLARALTVLYITGARTIALVQPPAPSVVSFDRHAAAVAAAVVSRAIWLSFSYLSPYISLSFVRFPRRTPFVGVYLSPPISFCPLRPRISHR